MADPAGSGGWTTIESDPGLFTELVEAFGVRGVVFEELWALDRDSLAQLGEPVHGLIFLFKYEQEHYGGGGGGGAAGAAAAAGADGGEGLAAVDVAAGGGAAEGGRVFFARQVISNACATQAILSILLNRGRGVAVPDGEGGGGVDLGPELSSFAEFTADFPADLKGLAIGNSDAIRSAHNAFARPDPILQDEKRRRDDDEGEAFHFVAYVPRGGTLWELDGLREGPIPLCEATDGDWLDKIGPIVQSRIEKFSSSGEIRFNLMALVADQRPRLRAALARATARRAAALRAAAAAGGDAGGGGGDAADAEAAAAAAEQEAAAALADAVDNAGSAAKAEALREQAAKAAADATTAGSPDAEALVGRAKGAAVEAGEARGALAREAARREGWRRENVRRRHNYVPLVFQVARLLAERGQLRGLLEQAEQRRRDKEEKERAEKEKGGGGNGGGDDGAASKRLKA